MSFNVLQKMPQNVHWDHITDVLDVMGGQGLKGDPDQLIILINDRPTTVATVDRGIDLNGQ